MPPDHARSPRAEGAVQDAPISPVPGPGRASEAHPGDESRIGDGVDRRSQRPIVVDVVVGVARQLQGPRQDSRKELARPSRSGRATRPAGAHDAGRGDPIVVRLEAGVLVVVEEVQRSTLEAQQPRQEDGQLVAVGRL